MSAYRSLYIFENILTEKTIFDTYLIGFDLIFLKRYRNVTENLMIFQFLALIIFLGFTNPNTIEEQWMSCSCKKKKKSTYKENIIACFCDEEPLLEEDC